MKISSLEELDIVNEEIALLKIEQKLEAQREKLRVMKLTQKEKEKEHAELLETRRQIRKSVKQQKADDKLRVELEAAWNAYEGNVELKDLGGIQ